MDRVTFRLPAPLLEQAETIVEEESYKDRSEFIREAVREAVQQREVQADPREGKLWTTVKQQGDD